MFRRAVWMFMGNLVWFVDVNCFAASTVTPELFAPGVISGPANDEAPAFTPDGKTVYFVRNNGADYDLMVSHFDGKDWSQPQIAPFSGQWRDSEPSMAPDGSFMLFTSSRPTNVGGKPLDGIWLGQVHAGMGGNLWRVDRKGSGWSEPVRLPDTVNFTNSVFSPSIAGDGSVYFMAATGEGGHFQLYRSPFQNGAYQSAKALSFSTGKFGDADPAIAPDQSFIVFSSNRPSESKNGGLFITFRKDGQWGEPMSLGPDVNRSAGNSESRLGPDGHTLY